MARRIGAALTVLLLAAGLVLASCGGGGGGAIQPQNQQPPGQQPPQQPPGQQPLPQTQAATPDALSIVAIFDDQTMSFAMTCAPGTVLPNANIVIEDPQNFTATTTANANGMFEILQADIPPNFMTAPGTLIKVYQFTADTLRSEPASVPIFLASAP